jgi:hypothetical protein
MHTSTDDSQLYLDDKNDYDTFFIVNDNKSQVVFTSTRKRDTLDLQDFVIPHNQTFEVDYSAFMLDIDAEYKGSIGKFDLKFCEHTKRQDASASSQSSRYKQTGRYDLHGWLMFCLWIVGGGIQLASKRYFISNWRSADQIHAVMGTVMVLGTLTNIIDLFKVYGAHRNIHVILGFVCVSMDLIMMVTGMASYFVQRWGWKQSEGMRRFFKLHRIMGYLTLTMNLIVCFGGTVTYAYNFLRDIKLIWIGSCTTFAMLVVTIFSEIVYRRWRRP